MPGPGSNSPVQLYRTTSFTVYAMRASMSTGNIRDRRKQSKRWFGDSKVVDEDGEPLVVYHADGRDPKRKRR